MEGMENGRLHHKKFSYISFSLIYYYSCHLTPTLLHGGLLYQCSYRAITNAGPQKTTKRVSGCQTHSSMPVPTHFINHSSLQWSPKAASRPWCDRRTYCLF